MPNLVQDSTGNDLTYRIIGAAMQVHNQLGPGYKEEVYERALQVELNTRSIPAVSQFPVSVDFQGEVVGLFNDEVAQVINYLKATKAEVGLLFNFGRRSLEYRRIFPGKNSGPVQRIGRDDVRKFGRD